MIVSNKETLLVQLLEGKSCRFRKREGTCVGKAGRQPASTFLEVAQCVPTEVYKTAGL
jgi:hypothetical protein